MTRRLALGVPALIVLTAALLAAPASTSASRASATRAQKFAVYSVTKREQFINNNDDESRGDVNNPFGRHDRTAAQAIQQSSNGPYPGDEAVFTFTLYTGADLKTKAGSAVFTCDYYIAKNAFCDASFTFAGGKTLVGSGAFGFDAPSWALAITGGSGVFDSLTGDVEASPGRKAAQRLVFRLQ